MKNKRFIYLFLLLVSMIVVIAPAIPHHHHGDGIICMKDDIKEDDCCPVHHNHHHTDDPCCNDNCTAQFKTVLTNMDIDELQAPQFQYSVILFTQQIISLLNQFENKIPDKSYVYVESLHGTYITRAAGLRAPPYPALSLI